jgi:hypothetical protein
MTDPVLVKAFDAVLNICEPLTPEQRRRILVALAFALSDDDRPPSVDDLVKMGIWERRGRR